MTAARVFVPHLPTRLGRGDRDGVIIPAFDLSPARAHGELVYVLPDTHNPFNDPQATMDLVRDRLAETHFWQSDILLLVGSPILISMVAVIAARRTGQLNMLQWDGRRRQYNRVDVKIDGFHGVET